MKYGQIAYGVSGNNSGDNYAIAQDDNGVYEFTKALTPSAIGLMSIVSTDTAEILVADDRVSGWTSDAINPNTIVVDAGTTTVIGAFTVSGAKMNAQRLGFKPEYDGASLIRCKHGQTLLTRTHSRMEAPNSRRTDDARWPS